MSKSKKKLKPVKKKISGYSYIRNGKKIEVPPHKRTYHTLSERKKKEIEEGKAKNLLSDLIKRKEAVKRALANSSNFVKTKIEEWLEDDSRTDFGLKTREEKEKFISYYGSSPHNTIMAIALDDAIPDDQKGMCVELIEGYGKIAGEMELIEKLGLNLMVDNGSFKYSQRCPIFKSRSKIAKSKLVEPEDYFNYENAKEQSDFIYENYKKALANSKDPENISIIVPELIGSADITHKLHKDFISKFKDLQKKYGCKVWISLQFNPHSENWKEEASESIRRIDNFDIPKDWKVGLPYGKDFGLFWRGKHKSKPNRRFIFNEIERELPDYNVHLYGCGTPNKVNDIKEYLDTVRSIDSSSINKWSNYAHYLNPLYDKVQDSRTLRGKQGSDQNIAKHRGWFAESTDFSHEDWYDKENETFDMLARYIINLENFNDFLAKEVITEED
jgi:hypothetical protein